MMPVKRIDSDIITVLAAANDFTTSQGIPSAASINKEGRNIMVKEPECVGCTDAYDTPGPELRSVPFETDGQFELRSGKDGSRFLNFEGYAAVFGETAKITDHRGTFTESFAPSAFNRTLENRSRSGDQSKQIKFLFDHGLHPIIGAMPIGQLKELTPDSRGLHVKAQIPVNVITQPIIDGIEMRAITGMSINFQAVQDDWAAEARAEHQHRTVTEAALFELGPVLTPAYSGTEASLRSLAAHLGATNPELFSAPAFLPPADPEPIGSPTLDVYKRILNRR